MNPYTNLTTAKFDPLSLQEIMMVPLARQKQHEEQQQALAEMGALSVNKLDVDNEIVNKEISALQKRNEEAAEALMNKGTGRGLSKQVMLLKADRDRFLSSEGTGGKAQAQYMKYLDNVKAIESNKNLSEAHKRAGIEYELNKYNQSGGVANNGSYNDYRGVDNADISKIALETASLMSPQEITQITGWSQTAEGNWTNGTQTTEKLPQELITQAVMQRMKSDPRVTSYLNESQKLGLIDNPEYEMYRSAVMAGNVKQIDNYSESEDFRVGRASVIDSGKITPPGSAIELDYNTVSSPTPLSVNKGEEFTKEMSIIDNIINGSPFSTNEDYQPTSLPYGFYTSTGKLDGRKYNITDDIPPERMQEYQKIADKLVETGIIEKTFNKKSDKELSKEQLEARNKEDFVVLKAIKDFKTKFKDYTYGVTIVNDTSGGVGFYSSGQTSKDSTAVLKQANIDSGFALYMNPVTGEVLPWTKLGATAIHSVPGYVDLDNNLTENVPHQYKDRASEFVSPQAAYLVDKDGKKMGVTNAQGELLPYYMTRNDGQNRSKRYSTDVKLNNFYKETRTLPTLPVDYNLGGVDVVGSYLPEKQLNEKISELHLQIYNEDGTIKEDVPVDIQKEYSSIIKAKQSVGPREGVWLMRPKNQKNKYPLYVSKKGIQEMEYSLNSIHYYYE